MFYVSGNKVYQYIWTFLKLIYGGFQVCNEPLKPKNFSYRNTIFKTI